MTPYGDRWTSLSAREAALDVGEDGARHSMRSDCTQAVTISFPASIRKEMGQSRFVPIQGKVKPRVFPILLFGIRFGLSLPLPDNHRKGAFPGFIHSLLDPRSCVTWEALLRPACELVTDFSISAGGQRASAGRAVIRWRRLCFYLYFWTRF